jgi:quinol monooxygenase YgiN
MKTMTCSLPALIVLFLAATFAAFGQDAKLYVVTHVDLTPNYLVDGTKLLQKFASDTHKDKGVVRFELFDDISRKNHFTMVGVWENQAAFDAHLEADHTKQFREKLQPMLGSPFDERLHSIMQ